VALQSKNVSGGKVCGDFRIFPPNPTQIIDVGLGRGFVCSGLKLSNLQPQTQHQCKPRLSRDGQVFPQTTAQDGFGTGQKPKISKIKKIKNMCGEVLALIMLIIW